MSELKDISAKEYKNRFTVQIADEKKPDGSDYSTWQNFVSTDPNVDTKQYGDETKYTINAHISLFHFFGVGDFDIKSDGLSTSHIRVDMS